MFSTQLNKMIATATIHEYQMVTAGLARVTATLSDSLNKNELRGKIRASLQGHATPVKNSFTWLDANTAVGFVAAHTEKRVLSSVRDAQNRYRVLSSNIYLDNNDKSLWDLKEGAAGKYLTRRGHDNLEALIQSARLSPSGSTPRLNRVQASVVVTSDMIAFVDTRGNVAEVNYGFVTAAAGDKYRVICDASTALVVDKSLVVGSYTLEMPKVKSTAGTTKAKPAVTAADAGASLTPEAYWKKLFGSYGDAAGDRYAEMMVNNVREMAAL